MSGIEISRVIVTTVWAQDVQAATHFYQNVLCLEPFTDSGHEAYPHFKLGEGYLVILEGEPRPAKNAQPDHFPIFAMAVSDIDRAVDQLKTNNVDLPWGVQDQDHNRWVAFHDPAGNLIELAQDQ